ncbi:hypothetical protein BX283_3759 [Streptomyces sp. TLI_146]|nr:hypothetical protein BX283_3759 [Streptomyces sp. TLI_146]
MATDCVRPGERGGPGRGECSAAGAAVVEKLTPSGTAPPGQPVPRPISRYFVSLVTVLGFMTEVDDMKSLPWL